MEAPTRASKGRILLLFSLLVPALDAASIWSSAGRPAHLEHVQAAHQSPYTSLRAWLKATHELIRPGHAEGKRRLDSEGERAIAHLPADILKRYGADQVLRFETETDAQRESVAKASETLFLDVWGYTQDWVDIRLSKDSIDIVLGLLPADIKWRPVIHHLASTIFDAQSQEEGVGAEHAISVPISQKGVSLRETSSHRTNYFFQKYQPLSVIVPWMRLLESLFPTHVRIVEVGTSWEGRPIRAIRVGNHPHNAEEPETSRQTILVTGGSHAREWISTSTVNFAAYQLITGYGKDRRITKLIEEFDFVFVPTLNPDGYAYTWEEDRLWRKNRQSTKYSFCPGVDLDRSFGFEWNGENTMGNPCTENYAGEGPFDAHEAIQFAEWVKNRTESGSDQFVGFFDLHSYSQQILYPFSYTCDRAPGAWENLQEVALGLEKAIYTTTSRRYATSSACEGGSNLWPRDMNGGGSLLDWMLSQGTKYSYQIKLRDTGSYGFLLPAKEIVPTGKEIFAAVRYFAQYLLDSASVDSHEESPSTQEPTFSLGTKNEPIIPSTEQLSLNAESEERASHQGIELKRR